MSCTQYLRSKLRQGAVLALAVTAAVAATSEGVHAATIASWNINGVGGYGPSPFAATTEDPNVDVGGLTRGSGVATTGTAAGNAWGGSASDGPTDLASAIAGGNLATFTVKAATGYALSLSGFDAYNVRRSGTGPTTGQWQYSLDGSNFNNIGSAITWGTNTSGTGNNQPAVDLSSIASLQNVADDTTVTFRVANWGATGATGTWYLNAGGTPKTFTVTGEAVAAAVPEPGSVALAALAAIATASCGRKRRS